MNNKKYRIICLGEYCLPRVITTFSGLKQRKIHGEKTCPFDLAFCWNFDGILDVIENEFKTFFQEVEYDYFTNESILIDLYKIFTAKLLAKVWKHESSGSVFNHENYTDRTKFIERYQKRIDNFYEYLKDESRDIYILIASFNPISNMQIQRLNSIIAKYHPKNHYNIIINQSQNNISTDINNTFIINCNDEKYLKMYKGNWVKTLENHFKYPVVDEFYNLIINELNEIISNRT